MQAWIKNWYDRLADGRICGARCERCGAMEFPPVAVCNSCSGCVMDWAEVSGRATMISVSASQRVDDPFVAYGTARVHAVARLEEGPTFISWLIDADPAQLDDLASRLPLPVRLEVHRRDDYAYPVFRLVAAEVA